MLKIDTDEVIEYTAKLGRLHRAALPNAVRNTLNNAAFQTKREIPEQAQRKFITRRKGFLRAFTTVDKATGFDMKKMIAKTGINSKKGSQVAKGLVAQEFGGNLYTSQLVPHDDSRVAKQHERKLRSKNWLKKVNAHDASSAFRAHKGTRGSKFVSAVMSTAKSGKKYMILKTGGTGMLYEIRGLKQSRKTGRLSFNVDKLYSIKSSKNASVKGKHFIRSSRDRVVKKIPDIYKDNAEYQIKKYWK